MLFLFQWVQAQQQYNFLFFEQNLGIYNPAFIGKEVTFVGLGYRAVCEKSDFGFGYMMGQRTSRTALRANTHELFLRFKFGNQAKFNVKESNTL